MEADDADGIYRDLCDFCAGDPRHVAGLPGEAQEHPGSCGGISALGLEKVCDCPEPCDARKKRLAREAQRQQRRIL
ncbi:hypothetical protein KPRYC492_20550 [Klebsiella pneumoniae RYC492]|nr:hypothetical protein KPRYC492_20550 [Klebsiella pneumoniae RYC492]